MTTLLTKGNWTAEYEAVENGYNVFFLFKKDSESVCFDSGIFSNLEDANTKAIEFVDYYSNL